MVVSFGLMMIYFIVFGDTFKSLIFQIVYGSAKQNFLTTRACYVILLAAVLFPMVIKKELKELKIASVILFLGISSFIVILTGQIIFEPSLNEDKEFTRYWDVDKDLTVVKGLSMIIVAYGF